MGVNYIFVQSGLVFIAGMSGRVLNSLFALSLGAQTITVGLLLAVNAGCQILMSWPVGRLADRYGPRWFMIGGSLCGMVGALVPVAFPSLPSLFVASFMMGLTSSIVNVLAQMLVGALSTPRTATKNFANYAMVASVVAMVGPFFAGFSIDHFGYPETSYLLSLLLAASTMMLILHPGKLPASKAPTKASSGFRETLRDPRVIRIVVLSGTLQVGLDVFQSFLPVYAHGIGLSASLIGAVIATNAVASFSTRTMLPRLLDKLGSTRVLVAAMWVGAVAMLLIPLAPNVVALGAVCFMFGLGMGCGFPVTTLLVHESAGKDGRAGEAFGIRLAANGVVRTVGPTVCGSLGTALGMGSVFCLAACILGGAAYLLRKRNWLAGIAAVGEKDVGNAEARAR